jgi:hypothetical protein
MTLPLVGLPEQATQMPSVLGRFGTLLKSRIHRIKPIFGGSEPLSKQPYKHPREVFTMGEARSIWN